MNMAALAFMLLTLGLVTGMTFYFFIKVLKVPPKTYPVNPGGEATEQTGK
ncbi:hypothetical protein [Sabulibacter ruber]|nr:hypothetical protein [Sabulibacter ruber]